MSVCLSVTAAPTLTGNSGNNISYITALLKAVHCGDLTSHSPALFYRMATGQGKVREI